MLGVVLNRAEEQPHPSSYYYHRRYYNRDRNGGKPKEVAPTVEEEVAIIS